MRGDRETAETTSRIFDTTRRRSFPRHESSPRSPAARRPGPVPGRRGRPLRRPRSQQGAPDSRPGPDRDASTTGPRSRRPASREHSPPTSPTAHCGSSDYSRGRERTRVTGRLPRSRVRFDLRQGLAPVAAGCPSARAAIGCLRRQKIRARETMARYCVEELRAEVAELAVRLERDREDLSRSEITRETAAQVLAELSQPDGPAHDAPDSKEASAPHEVVAMRCRDGGRASWLRYCRKCEAPGWGRRPSPRGPQERVGRLWDVAYALPLSADERWGGRRVLLCACQPRAAART